MSVSENDRKAVRLSMDKLLKKYWYWLVWISEPHTETLLKQRQFELLRAGKFEQGVRQKTVGTETS
jgi:hypothetical protein